MKVEVKAPKYVFQIIAVFIIIMLIWCVSGIGLIMIKTHDYVKTDATIDKIIYDDYRSTDDNVSTVTTYYQVSYTSYANCTSKQYTADITKGMFVNKTENDKLTVYYNPDNPEELRPDMSHGIFAVIIFGLILIGIIVFITKGEFK